MWSVSLEYPSVDSLERSKAEVGNSLSRRHVFCVVWRFSLFFKLFKLSNLTGANQTTCLVVLLVAFAESSGVSFEQQTNQPSIEHHVRSCRRPRSVRVVLLLREDPLDRLEALLLFVYACSGEQSFALPPLLQLYSLLSP